MFITNKITMFSSYFNKIEPLHCMNVNIQFWVLYEEVTQAWRCQQTIMDSLKKSCQILNPFLNVFSPVMLTSLKQNCKVSSQHQNPRRFCFVEMNIEKKKIYLRYCARRPKILSTNLTDQVTRYASSQFPKGLHDDKSKKIPNMQKGM